ncbi:amino acid ABC transporter permease [Pseudomonas sp. NPDC089554]|uniref:amino acid ABC transporter permease n=1 Tax=Pseudomonas sp. NPDC089554 TaxID=3390653 RepID=UPI003D01F8B9
MTADMLSFYQDFLEQWPLIQLGIWATLKLTLTVSLSGLLLGSLVFYLSLSRNRRVSRCIAGFKSFFIGTPLVCILYVAYYGLPALIFKLSPFEAAVAGFTLNVAAYNASYMASAYNGLDKTQVESAQAQGFNDRQVFRYVIFPQVLRASVPALTNQVLYNLKDSSIAFLIQYPELLARMQELASGNFEFFKVYALTAVFYIALASIIYCISTSVERRLPAR